MRLQRKLWGWAVVTKRQEGEYTITTETPLRSWLSLRWSDFKSLFCRHNWQDAGTFEICDKCHSCRKCQEANHD